MSAISQRQVQKMLQKLSPQQIQMIKLLELPTLQLEQRIKQEIEENPVLEEEESPEEEQEAKEVSVVFCRGRYPQLQISGQQLLQRR